MNIILIGCKACGKTTLAHAFANLTHKKVVDTDARIEEIAHTLYGSPAPCRELYTRWGEEAFRRMESMAVASLLWEQNCIVATGGGVVLSAGNKELLQRAGCCVFVDTPLPLIKKRMATENSPLLHGTSIENLYTERLPLYKATAHCTLSVAEEDSILDMAQNLQRLLEEYTCGQ